MCAAPAYLATGINGLATLSFDGNTALATRAFTNRPDTVRSLFVFCVFSRDRAYEKTTPYGPWNGPFSFSSAVNSGIDPDYTTGFCGMSIILTAPSDSSSEGAEAAMWI